jgi:hypothetical protein
MLASSDFVNFGCPMGWAGVRELLNCDWNPAGAGDFISLANNVTGSLRRIVWFTFATLYWTLGNTRNKLTIEGKMIGNPADIFYRMSGSGQTEGPGVAGRGRARCEETTRED